MRLGLSTMRSVYLDYAGYAVNIQKGQPVSRMRYVCLCLVQLVMSLVQNVVRKRKKNTSA